MTMDTVFRKYVNCLFAALIFFYDFFQMNILNTLGTSIQEKFSLTMEQYGVFASSYFYCMLPTFLLAGFILDRYNTKKIILSVAFTYAICAFLFATTNSVFVLFSCRAISGACGGFCLLSLIVLASKEFGKENISKITGLMISIGMLGGMFAQSPLQSLLARFCTNGTLIINAFLGLIIAFLIFAMVRDDKKITEKNSIRLSEIKSIVKNSQLVIIGMYAGLLFLPMSILGGFFGTEYLLTRHQITIEEASFVSGTVFLGFIFGSSFFGFISGTIVPERICMIAGIILTFAYAVIAVFLSNSGSILLSVIFFLMGFFSAAQIISFSTVAKIVPTDNLGASEGIMSVIIMLQTALFQTSFGYLFAISGNYDLSMITFLMLLFVGVLVSFFIRTTKRKLLMH